MSGRLCSVSMTEGIVEDRELTLALYWIGPVGVEEAESLQDV